MRGDISQMYRLFAKDRDIHESEASEKPRSFEDKLPVLLRPFANAVAKTCLCYK